MKYLHCLTCTDIKAITQNIRYCSCRQSWAKYIDDRVIKVRGPALILGIENATIESLAAPDPPVVNTFYAIKEPKSTIVRAAVKVNDGGSLTPRPHSARLVRRRRRFPKKD